jgi:hypothetical protein
VPLGQVVLLYVTNLTSVGIPTAFNRLAPDRSALVRKAKVRKAPDRLAPDRSVKVSAAPDLSQLCQSTPGAGGAALRDRCSDGFYWAIRGDDLATRTWS